MKAVGYGEPPAQGYPPLQGWELHYPASSGPRPRIHPGCLPAINDGVRGLRLIKNPPITEEVCRAALEGRLFTPIPPITAFVNSGVPSFLPYADLSIIVRSA